MLTGPVRRFSARSGRQGAAGMSLVELMVGIAVGMFVVAAASMVASSQLTNNRRLLVETQLQQDLRATADIITRDVRRSGAFGNTAYDAHALVSTPTTSAGVNVESPLTVTADRVEFRARRQIDIGGPWGYKLEGGVIKTQLISGWQPLTDSAVMTVTGFSVTADDEPPVVIPCPKLCTGGTTSCWPTVTVRTVSVAITAKAVGDPAVVRSVSTRSRLKNDLVSYRGTPATQACPD